MDRNAMTRFGPVGLLVGIDMVFGGSALIATAIYATNSCGWSKCWVSALVIVTRNRDIIE
jgi:hypothetical protein